MGHLDGIAGWLSEKASLGGNYVPDIAMVECAEALAADYVLNTGKPQWAKVEEHILKAFNLGDIGNKKAGDWVYQQVKNDGDGGSASCAKRKPTLRSDSRRKGTTRTRSGNLRDIPKEICHEQFRYLAYREKSR